MEKKYQVFISSTYTDLIEARAKVRDAILSMYHFPVGMELFGAASEEQWEIIKDTIDSSDYYVLIIAHRYGSVIQKGEDAGISYTEKEFRYAKKIGIPILAFIIDDSVKVTPDTMESDKKAKKRLDAFVAEVKTGRTVVWWTSVNDLAQKVTSSLYNEFKRSKRPGWIRSDAVDIEKSLKTITELTERNQQLVDENKALLLENQELKQKTERVPKLIITFDADEPDEDEKENTLYSRKDNIHQNEDEDIVYLKVGIVGTNLVEAEYLPLSKADFIGELCGQVTDKEIQAYNQALPSKKEMDNYLETYKAYHMIVDHGIAVSVVIHNIGTAKATDISAVIEFPHEISVYNIDDVRKMNEPDAPRKPKDLQEIAYARAHKSETALETMYEQIARLGEVEPGRWPILPLASVGNTVFESVDIYDNKVEIETKSGIVHTKFDWFRGIYLVPSMKGTFKGKATLMCAEYKDPEEIEITFVCE